MTETNTVVKKDVSAPNKEALFDAGAHYGYSRSRRHPSFREFIITSKNGIDIINIEKIEQTLNIAKEFIGSLRADNKKILFVGTKPEAAKIVRKAAEESGAMFITQRWIGGTLTNFSEIKKRLARLKKLREQKEQGELVKYTKKEQLLFDRETEKLEALFGGIVEMEKSPSALFIVDPRYEDTAVREAIQLGIPIIALASSDCDISKIKYPITANDSTQKSITFFVDEIAGAYSSRN